MPDEARRARRGPKPNPNRGTPSGFRVTDRDRFELQVAAAFVGARNLQETVDVAVAEFLDGMRDTEGFVEAVIAAEKSQQKRTGIKAIPSPSE